jgi:hypothetical protein
MTEPASLSTLLPKLAPAAPSLAAFPVNRAEMQRSAADVFAAADRLNSYRSNLAVARAAKQSAVDLLPDARAALDDVGVLCRGAASVLSSAYASGLVDRTVQAAADMVRTAGTLDSADVWTQITTSTEMCAAIARAGVSGSLLNALGEALQRQPGTISTDGTLLVVSTKPGDKAQQAGIETGPRVAPQSLSERMAAGRFWQLCDAISQGEQMYPFGAAPAGVHPRYEDLVMQDLLNTQREGIRHVRKLEDAGLIAEAGGGAGTIIAVIAIMAVLGSILSIAECGDSEDGSGPSGACVLCILLLLPATILGLTSVPSPSSTLTPTTQVNGSPLVNGPLPQLVAAAQ